MNNTGVVLLSLALLPAAPPLYPDKANLLLVRDADGKLQPVRNADDWATRREHILLNMQEVMGKLPDAAHKVPLDVQVSDTVREKNFTRQKLTFAVEKNDRVPAYLFIPHERKGKLPAVLCLHQTIRVGKAEVAGIGNAALPYGRELAERGYVTLAPDYPNFGDYKFNPYHNGYASATMKAIWNHMRAVDLLVSLPEVDAERLGVMGHSLGGHNSMFVAAFDPRLRCIVTNCGFCSFPTYYGGKLAGWSHDGYMPRIRTVYELKPEKMPFDFPEVVASLAPRPFLAIAPVKDANFDIKGVKDCISAATPVYRLFDAEKKCAAEYPDLAHDFPPKMREAAYAWMDRWLKVK